MVENYETLELKDDRLKKTERLLKIWIFLIKNPAGCSVKSLSKKFGVHERTIYRDMLTLGEDLSVPVYNDNKIWKIEESYFLPPIRFTIPEALNIFLATRLMLAHLHRYDPNMDATFTKLISVLPSVLSNQVNKTMEWMQELPKNENLIQIVAITAEAWIKQRKLKIQYQSIIAEEAKERIIDTYFIEPAAPGHASYIIGYCHLKKSVRIFKMERIQSASIMDEKYDIPVDFDANEFFKSSWGISIDGDIKVIKIRIKSPDVIKLVEESVWHPSQVLEKQKDGSMVMTLKIIDTYEFYSWVLGWGDRVEVLEPFEVRKAVIETIKKMSGVYKS
jgi:predicted DNA-binding transcriptional regulator YafY